MSNMKETGKEEINIEKVEHALTETEMFIEKYQKQLLTGLGAVVFIVCAFIGMRHFYFVPRESNAAIALFPAEKYFQKDSFMVALNGDGAHLGFVALADEFSGTKAGNLANAYAGISYARLGENEKAIEYLKKFDANDNSVEPATLELLGDCLTNLNKLEDAIASYEKAAKSENPLIAPLALMKAGKNYDQLNKFDKAIVCYTTIKDKYASSMEAYDVDKYIAASKVRAGK